MYTPLAMRVLACPIMKKLLVDINYDTFNYTAISIHSPPASTVQPTSKTTLTMALASVVFIMTVVVNSSLQNIQGPNKEIRNLKSLADITYRKCNYMGRHKYELVLQIS